MWSYQLEKKKGERRSHKGYSKMSGGCALAKSITIPFAGEQ